MTITPNAQNAHVSHKYRNRVGENETIKATKSCSDSARLLSGAP